MADIAEAVQFVLHQEDSRLSGAITSLPGDSGGPTRFGLASRFHPDLVEQDFYEMDGDEPKIPHDEALSIAEHVYLSGYGEHIQLAEIESQDVADRLLSFAINEGPAEAVAVAQRALNASGAQLVDDGVMGPKTLAALNDADPDVFLSSQRHFQEAFYRHMVTVRPSLLPYLNAFLTRAAA